MLRRPAIAAGCMLAALTALPFGLAACGADSGADGQEVVATTGIVAELAERVAGPDLEVVQLVPDGASPHDFALSARDRQTLGEAELIVASGAGLEAGIPIDGAGPSSWALAEHAGALLPFEDAGAHAHGERDGMDEDADEESVAEEHGTEAEPVAETGEHDGEAGPAQEAGEHSGGDPHVWMDPARTAAALGSLATAIAEVDPEHADAYERRAREYARELRALDRKIAGALTVVPADRRELVTSHDSLGYFADRYGFEVVATPFSASGPEAEASPARLAEVIEAIEEHGVPAVFAQRDDDPEVLRRIAGEAGVTVVEGLLVESPAEAGSYEEMLRRDAELIASALRPRG